MSTRPPSGFNLIEERITVGRRRFDIVRPRSAEELIDEDEYATDERLPYWAELWPSGRVLAEWLERQDLAGARVVELGCGIALPSLVAAAAGASVLATDWYQPALEFVRHNAMRLGLGVDTMLADWRNPPRALIDSTPFDVVLAADVVYEPRYVSLLRALIPTLAGPSGQVVLADPRRPDATSLLGRLRRDGWHCETTEAECASRSDESGPVVQVHRLSPPSPVRRDRTFG